MLDTINAYSALPVLTDVHTVEQAEEAAAVCDVLQIPAMLCRQTDLLQAVAETGCPINIKKGQAACLETMLGAVDKVRRAGSSRHYPIAVTERGSFFGYNDLVVDMRNIQRIQHACGCVVIFDATHSVQRTGLGMQGRSGGDPEAVAPLARAAVAAGADGVFLEVHPSPQSAPCDADSMLPLDQLLPLVKQLVAIRKALHV